MRSLETTLVQVASAASTKSLTVAGHLGTGGPPRCPAAVGVCTW